MKDCDNSEIPVFPPNNRKTLEWIAVLSAKNLDYRLSNENGRWTIHIPETHKTTAESEIAAYEDDELRRIESRPSTAKPEFYAPTSWSPLWVAGFITAFYLWLGPYDPDNAVLRGAAGYAIAIRQGEWWRLITSLTLHSGITHLLGNIVSLLAFGWWTCKIFGGGLGWLLILCSGILGNMAAPLIGKSSGTSVGASTACFGALGIITAFHMVGNARTHGISWSLWNRTWLPVGAGIAMLAILGAAPGTDVTAHAAGFISGFILSVPFSLNNGKWVSGRLQRVLQIICIVIVMSAWRTALRNII